MPFRPPYVPRFAPPSQHPVDPRSLDLDDPDKLPYRRGLRPEVPMLNPEYWPDDTTTHIFPEERNPTRREGVQKISAGNIFGEGPRGGIFGARVDPALLRELEQRAEAKRRMAQGLESAAAEQPIDTRPTFEKSLTGRILAAPSKLFGGLVVDPAVEGITDLLTLTGNVKRGEQPTMSADPQTGEMHTDPRFIERTANAAGAMTLGAGAIPAEANALRMGIKAPKIFSDYSKVGHDIPVTETAPIYVPGSGPKLIEKTFDPMTLKPGDRLVGSVGDRSHTGEDLGGIDIAGKQVMFKNPVPSEGGAGYMSHEFNPQDAFWASNQNPITLQEQRLLAHQKAAEKKSGDVYVVTQAMAAPGIDFSMQATRTALETLRRQPLNKEAQEALYTAIDEAMAASRGKQFPAIADWPGMAKVMKSDRLLREMIGTRRSKLMKILDTDAMRKLGAPNIGAVRYAATAPEQRNASVLESGFGWTKLGGDVKKLSPEEVLRGHDTYPWVNTSPGSEYVGSQPMPVEVLFPGLARRVRGMDASGQQRTASMADVYEVVTPRQLERFDRWLKSERGKKLGIAGAVAAGVLTAAQANALFGEEETARPTA